MSYLTDNPDLMMEVLAVLVRRAGGSVTIEHEESPGAFNLISKWDREGQKLHLVLEEGPDVREAILTGRLARQ